ncbi:hypothetical protein B1757_04795 [Acidithiobacillus marinus]|uniref:SMP-30/Gluconolactonase/LRE-like region domain-containing protein n=1 Tax=Acidithiobacillus marinus TaxID=187490 RepID=A0A2I1DND2_9PROT|nr:hypothetical protein [Acidithiobacillus marinus]PKY11373.1 hypothetical protein B1757_04795 [Acidithiobacillus marinus]
MRSRLLHKSIVFLIIIFSMVFDIACAETISFKLIKIIPLPTVDKGGDAVSYDPYDHAVYVSMGKTDAGAVVIDAKNNRIIKIIHDGLLRPYGMSFDKHYVYWTANYLIGKNTLIKDPIQRKVSRIFVVDKKDWKVVNIFNTIGCGADGIWVDQKLDRLYIAMDDNNWIDEYTLGQHPVFMGKIHLYPETGSGPDLGVLLASSHVLYMPDDSWEEIINLLTKKIEEKINIAPRAPSSSPDIVAEVFATDFNGGLKGL